MELADVKEIYQSRIDQENLKGKLFIEEQVPIVMGEIDVLFSTMLNYYSSNKEGTRFFELSPQKTISKITNVEEGFYLPDGYSNATYKELRRIIEENLAERLRGFTSNYCKDLVEHEIIKVEAHYSLSLDQPISLTLSTTIHLSDLEKLKKVRISNTHPYFIECIRETEQFKINFEHKRATVLGDLNKFFDKRVRPVLDSLDKGKWNLYTQSPSGYRLETRLIPVPFFKTATDPSYIYDFNTELTERIHSLGGVFADVHTFLEEKGVRLWLKL